MTMVQASRVSPEANAITERPAMTSQKNKEPRASSWEMMSQIRIGLRVAGLVSK